MMHRLWILAIAGAVSAAAPSALPPLSLKVQPTFMVARRGDIRVEARIPRSAENRQLSIAWSSDVGSAGSTQHQIDGEDDAVLHTLNLPSQPAANYLFVAALYDRAGKLRSRQEARIHTPEIEQASDVTKPEYVATVVINRQDSYDFGDLRYYKLTFGTWANVGNGDWIDITVSADSDLAAFLDAHERKRVSFVLRAGGPLTRDAEGQ